MNSYTLGLDLGANSIGWAIINDNPLPGETNIIAGVRVFPEGTDRSKETEKSRNVERREARLRRRQNDRRARRKRKLLFVLRNNGIFPLIHQRYQKTGSENALPDPYTLRKKALDEKLTLPEFGRVLMHLNQRRGFKSNAKTDDLKNSKVVREAVSDLRTAIKEAGARTLGEYFAGLDPHEQRIRGHYTERAMYEEEFELIWNKQAEFYPDILTDTAKKQIKETIFYQRPLKPQEHLIGECPFEHGEKRCPKASWVAHRFRILQDLTNLRISSPGLPERRLTNKELHLLLEKLHSTEKLTFEKIRKILNLAESDIINLENSCAKEIPGNPVESGIRKIFKKQYKNNPEKIRWLCTEVYDALIKEDYEIFRKKALTEWGLTDEQIDALYQIKRPQGYMAYSCKAMRKLIPLMEQGLDLYEAKEKLGYKDPEPEICDFLPPAPDIPNPVVRRALTETRKVVNLIIREYGKPSRIVVELARETKGTIKQRNERLKLMRKNEKYNNEIISKLKELEIPVNKQNIKKYKLAEECDWTCPYTGKKFGINELFVTNDFEIEHIIPYSRSFDNSLFNLTISEARFNRERKKDKTPYETFGDTEEFEQFCLRINKMENMPLAKKLLFQKTEVSEDFTNRQLTDTSYIAREVHKYLKSLGVPVNTTRGPITSELRHQWGLNPILWELNETLKFGENKSDEEKSRADHRHHAIDAIVIGLTNPAHIKALARTFNFWRNKVFPSPWESAGINREMFRQMVKSAVAKINVSYRPERKLSGQLHEETNYGRLPDGSYTYRVPLSDITLPQIENIVDPVVKTVVIARLRELGINPADKNAKIPKDAFKDLRMPAKEGKRAPLIKKVRIRKSFSNAIPVKDKEGRVYRYVIPADNHHVAVFEYKDSKGRIRRLKEVVSRAEAVRRKLNGEPVVRRTHPEHPEAKFLFSLCKQDMVILKCKDGVERLYRVQKFTNSPSTEGIDISFRWHIDARKDKEISKLHKTLRDIVKPRITSLSFDNFQVTKVNVDPLGRIRYAND